MGEEWLLENNPYLPIKQREIHKKIRETNAQRRVPTEEERAKGELGCPECYGYGILRFTRERPAFGGIDQWWTCDFCGNVEPTTKITDPVLLAAFYSGIATVLHLRKVEECQLEPVRVVSPKAEPSSGR